VVRESNIIKGCLLLYYLQVIGVPLIFSFSAGRQAVDVVLRCRLLFVIADVITEMYYVRWHCFRASQKHI
jgi:hypothetical protein